MVALRNSTSVNLVPKVLVSFGFCPSSCPRKWGGRAGQGMGVGAALTSLCVSLDDLQRDQGKSLPARGGLRVCGTW